MEEARIYKLELRITFDNQNEAFYSTVVPVQVKAEEILSQHSHTTIDSTSQGSLIIMLRAETNDTVTQLKKFIENGDMSLFLAELLKAANDQKLFIKHEQKIEIQIKKDKGKTLANIIFIKINYSLY